jgi:NifB/MoaA-like Fe-S oxidoreductase
MRLLINEYEEAFDAVMSGHKEHVKALNRTISIATGKLVYPSIKELADKAMSVCPGLKVTVYEIINEFFGERITVSGLLTGHDIIKQLKGKDLGDELFLPENLLRSGEDYLLDDVRIGDIERELGVNVGISKCDGHELVSLLLDIPAEELF